MHLRNTAQLQHVVLQWSKSSVRTSIKHDHQDCKSSACRGV